MAKQIILASWFTPSSIKKTLDKLPQTKTIDFVKQGLKPTAENPSGVLCELKDFPLAYYDIPTANKQIFQRNLWQKLLDDPDLQFRMKDARSFWGEPFHADSLEIMLPQVSHKITDFRVVNDNLVVGDVSVVDTPNGNIIYSLLKDSYVGISSRGYGSLLDQDDGNQIVSADDYYHVGWDFVGVPAVKDAMATLAGYAKSSKLYEPISKSLLASARFSPDLGEIGKLIQEENRKFSITVPDLHGGTGTVTATEVDRSKASADTLVASAEAVLREAHSRFEGDPEAIVSTKTLTLGELDEIVSGIFKRAGKSAARGLSKINPFKSKMSFRSFDKKGSKAIAAAFDQLILPAIQEKSADWYKKYVDRTQDPSLSSIFGEYLEAVLDILADVDWGDRPLITRNSIKNYVMAISEWAAADFGGDPEGLIDSTSEWYSALPKLIDEHAKESDAPITEFRTRQEFVRYMERFSKWSQKGKKNKSRTPKRQGYSEAEYGKWKAQREQEDRDSDPRFYKPSRTSAPRKDSVNWFEKVSNSAIKASEDPEAPKRDVDKDGYCVVERPDGSFWIEDRRRPSFEQGPYESEDEAASRLLTIWLLDPEVSGDGNWSQEKLSQAVDLYFDTGVYKRFIKQFDFRWNTNNIPFPTEGDDGKWYLAFGKVVKLGPFENEEEAMKVLHDNYPKGMRQNQSRKPSADATKITQASGGWTYEYAHGGLSVAQSGKEVAFLQGDEAAELYDQLESAQTDAQVDAMLGPYLVNSSKQPIKSEEDLVPEGDVEDAGDEFSEDEAADREEFSKMVLLELAETLEDSDDDFEDDGFADMPDMPDLDDKPIEESKQPIKSEEDLGGELSEGEAKPAEDEGDFGDEDTFFPSESEGSVTVDEDAGTVTVDTVDTEGNSVSVELTLDDGVLMMNGSDTFEDEEGAEAPSVFPDGGTSMDLFDATNGDVSTAVDMILDLGSSGIADGTVIDLTDEDFDEDSLPAE